ncbi:diguanylate phosphodiesterase [Rhodospirillum sp. A1_3_36]|uniref:diguanylate phosphodiesterase n=1 Tax=Rhodospirillum sp. A1_3_36 TaxID=3391666 RepID=UPI0039A48F4C
MMTALAGLKQNPAGHQVAVIALSQLQPEFRRLNLVQRAAEVFAPLMRVKDGPLVFLPASLDIVILGRNLPRDAIRDAAGAIRALFGADPLARERAPGRDRFARWFDLARPDHMKAFATLADDIDQRSAEAAQATGAWNINDQPLTPKRLALLTADMENLDVAPLLHRQAVVEVTEDRRALLVHEEFLISLSALRKKVAEEVNLQSDRWLFQDFTRSLDRHLLRVLKNMEVFQKPKALSINMNLETLYSDAFAGFAAALRPDQTLVVEAQGVDVFADIGVFLRARDWLHDKGHKLLIDGLTPRTMETVDLGPLGADFYKLGWNPGLVHSVDGDDAAAARALIGAIGADKVILGRVDSEQAMAWGIRAGIHRFQGFFVDSMLGAMIHGDCPNPCGLGRCIASRRQLTGGLRDECHDKALLDGTTRIAAKSV